jgi:tetratricopeptide (TPR) repeat protein
MKPQQALAEARALQAQGRWDASASLLEEALREYEDPEIACECALARCYDARESEAMPLLGIAKGAHRYPDLLRILAAHFFARKAIANKLNRRDLGADDSLREVRRLAKEAGISIGTLPKPSLSAVLIVRNEARHLAQCMESVQPVCDEIVVVDTGSTDDTVSIAKNMGAVVGVFEWCDDFSAARNHALSLATSTWCLWIDADERLEPASYGAFLSAIVRPHFGGYTIPIINFLNQDESQDQIVHTPCRLFRRLPGVQFEGRIHEQIAPSIQRLGLPIAMLDARILHYGYRESEVVEKRKHERTISLLSLALQEDPDDDFQQFNLANAYYTAGKYEDALPWFEKAASNMQPGAHHGQFAFQSWAFCHFALGRFEEALAVCDRAVEKGFQGPLVEYARAFALKQLNRNEEALAAIERAENMHLDPRETGDRSILQYKLRFLRAQVYTALGETHKAEKDYRDVVAIVPGFAPAHLGLALELKRQGRLEDAFDAAQAALLADEEHAAIAVDLAVACAQEMNDPFAAVRVSEEAARAHPGSRPLWDRWLAHAERAEDWPSVVAACSFFAHHFDAEADVLIRAGRALMHTGKYQLALQCLEDACTLEPENPNAYWHVGDLLSRCERWAEAALAYRKGLTLDSTNPDAWFTLGNAMYYLGKPDAAVLALETALSLKPDHDKAKHNLALIRDELRERAS